MEIVAIAVPDRGRVDKAREAKAAKAAKARVATRAVAAVVDSAAVVAADATKAGIIISTITITTVIKAVAVEAAAAVVARAEEVEVATAEAEAEARVVVAAAATSSSVPRAPSSDPTAIRSFTKAISKFPRRALDSCVRPRAILPRSPSMFSSRRIRSSASACAKAARLNAQSILRTRATARSCAKC